MLTQALVLAPGGRLTAAVAGWWSNRPPGATIEGVAPNLLERQAELHALGAAVERAAAGHGSTALVLGEAGIGKTSLIQAFLAATRSGSGLLAGRLRGSPHPARTWPAARRDPRTAPGRWPARWPAAPSPTCCWSRFATSSPPPVADGLDHRGRALGRRRDAGRAALPGPPDGGPAGPARGDLPRRRGRQRPSPAVSAGWTDRSEHDPAAPRSAHRAGRRAARRHAPTSTPGSCSG